MPIKLSKANQLPPGGRWQYFDPDLQVLMESVGLLDDFPREVNAKRIDGGHRPIREEELMQRILQYVCDRAPPGFCRGHVKTQASHRMLTVSQVSNFTRTLVKVAMHKLTGRTVSNPDPEAAARVCVNCPLNRREFCSTCTGLEIVARKVLRQSQTTKYDRLLGACEACGCMLRVKVHYNPELLRDSVLRTDEARYPKENCWIWNEDLLK